MKGVAWYYSVKTFPIPIWIGRGHASSSIKPWDTMMLFLMNCYPSLSIPQAGLCIGPWTVDLTGPQSTESHVWRGNNGTPT